MKTISVILPFITFLQTATIVPGLTSVSLEMDRVTKKTEAATPSPMKFKTRFVSLKRKHFIAPSYLTFKDGGEFEIITPGEKFTKTSGFYSRNGLFFKAFFETTLLRQKKHYLYTFTIKGIALSDRYIAGVLALRESIKETKQKQEVTFLFLGQPEESSVPEKKGRSLFPF